MQRSDFCRWAILPMRFVVGYGFMEHGVAKLLRGPDAFAGILQQLGVPLPHLAAWLTICTEILGGLAVLLGLLVSWVSIPMAVVLLTAMFSVHMPYGFSSVKLLSVSSSGATFGPVGYEVDLLYLAALVTLVLQGPGPLQATNCALISHLGRIGSDTGIVRQNLQSVAETRETVLFQPVGAQELSIAVSSFQRLASPVPPTFSKNSKKEPGTEGNRSHDKNSGVVKPGQTC